jgi:hypothetical protein
MKRLELQPNGWPCRLDECPPGPFVNGNDSLGFKSEYSKDGKIEAYNEAGEFFVAGCSDEPCRREIMVQPVLPVWVDDD